EFLVVEDDLALALNVKVLVIFGFEVIAEFRDLVVELRVGFRQIIEPGTISAVQVLREIAGPAGTDGCLGDAAEAISDSGFVRSCGRGDSCRQIETRGAVSGGALGGTG